jgi:hypothetical protein
MLEEGGVPSIVNRTLVRPPSSRVGPLTPEERKAVMATSPVGAAYDQVIDRESAFEVLQQKAARAAPVQAPAPPPASAKAPRAPDPAPRQPAPPPQHRATNREGVGEAMLKSVARNVTGQLTRSVTRELVRGILGGLSRGL